MCQRYLCGNGAKSTDAKTAETWLGFEIMKKEVTSEGRVQGMMAANHCLVVFHCEKTMPKA